MEGCWDEIGEDIPLWPLRQSSRSSYQACGFEMLYQESKNRADATSISETAV